MFKKLLTVFMASLMIIGAAVMTVSAEKHEVQKGESLWGIANQYDTTINEIVKINDLKSVVLQPKQVLTIEDEKKEEKKEVKKEKKAKGEHTVKSGDTLGKIAKEYGVKVSDLKKWNGLNNSLIYVDQKLNVDGKNVKQAKKATAEKPLKKSEKPAMMTASSEQKPQGKTITVTATAYTAKCAGCSGITYTGVDLNKNRNAKVIAVDPNVIPLGSKVYVEGYGYATAEDTGGAIKGNKIDLHVPTKDQAFAWGVRTVNVTIIN